MIRLAKLDDIPQCVEIVKEFYGQTPQADIAPFSIDNTKHFMKNLLESENATFFVAEVGSEIVGIAAMGLSLNPFSEVCVVAHELFWYVRPEFRGTTVALKLMNALESYAKDNDADCIIFVSIECEDSDKAQHIYERKGYKKLETNYIRRM